MRVNADQNNSEYGHFSRSVYDPEIATLELQGAADQELYFCAGNWSKLAF